MDRGTLTSIYSCYKIRLIDTYLLLLLMLAAVMGACLYGAGHSVVDGMIALGFSCCCMLLQRELS